MHTTIYIQTPTEKSCLRQTRARPVGRRTSRNRGQKQRTHLHVQVIHGRPDFLPAGDQVIEHAPAPRHYREVHLRSGEIPPATPYMPQAPTPREMETGRRHERRRKSGALEKVKGRGSKEGGGDRGRPTRERRGWGGGKREKRVVREEGVKMTCRRWMFLHAAATGKQRTTAWKLLLLREPAYAGCAPEKERKTLLSAVRRHPVDGCQRQANNERGAT